MTLAIKPAPVRRTLTVAVSPARAFEVFTAGFGSWWPKSHKIGASPFKSAVIEPHAGGRWYEVGEDGSECQWGNVLAWEPPSRLLLAWRLDATWAFDPALLTEIEVKFVAVAGGTRIEFEHRLLENMGERAEATRKSLDSEGGWGGILELYKAAV